MKRMIKRLVLAIMIVMSVNNISARVIEDVVVTELVGQMTADDAQFIASKIKVQGARGSGHAWGAAGRWEHSLLRTRIEGDEELLEKPLDALDKFTDGKYVNAHAKVKEMQTRLKGGHFTSFWP